MPRSRAPLFPPGAGVAQLVEQLIRNQQVTRSSRVAGSSSINVKSRDRGDIQLSFLSLKTLDWDLMTNTEQRRLTNWRLKVFQAAAERRQRRAHLPAFRISRKTFYKWRQRYRSTAMPDWRIVPARRTARRSNIGGGRQQDPASPAALPLRARARLPPISNVFTGCRWPAPRCIAFCGATACTVPANQKYRRHAHRWTRYEKAQPGHRLQVDVKFLERIAGARAAVLSIHRHRRSHPYSRAEGLHACNQRTAMRLH